MPSDASSALAAVRSKLAPFPPLRGAFDALYGAVAARDDAAFLLSGSLGEGAVVSDLSDLDVEIVARPGTDVAALRTWVREQVRALGRVVAAFPANHLGLVDLEVVFLERDGTIVKADVWTMDAHALPFVAGALALHDPGGFVASARASTPPGSPPTPDYADLHHKFVGWMWFTFSKSSRGQLFEAVESLDIMRSYALLPFLHLLAGNPPHGYRYLEQRLPEAQRTALLATYPRSHERAEVERAFWALVDLFATVQSDVQAKLGAPLRGADLAAMSARIRDHQASHTQ